ncbi:hypothetical protein A6A29_29800 [Streptomyces sp. TSRI0281]|nr:hypothetical protein A6A29_29800 [Streptomyces sp. TSRI0281]
MLAGAGLDWGAVHIVQTDERVTGVRSETSAAVIEDNLVRPARIPASRWHPMPGITGDDLARSAADYARTLGGLGGDGTPDIVLLGLGEDGHTASLFEGDTAAETAERVAVTMPYQGTVRLTLGAGLLAGARTRIVLAAGKAKAQAVSRLLNGDVPAGDPAARILGEDGMLFVDHEALAYSEAL